MEFDDLSLVIENGSSRMRCGISGNDSPYAFPSVVGTPKQPLIYAQMHGDLSQKLFG